MKILLFLADGFEEIEALSVVDILRRANIVCDMCSLDNSEVVGAHNIKVFADTNIKQINLKDYDGLVLPGGMPGAEHLKNSEFVINAVKEFNKEKKIVAAICAAPMVLGEAEILDGKKATSYPGFEEKMGRCNYLKEVTVKDDNILTSRGPATAIYFALKLVETLKSKAEVETLKEGMLVNFVEDALK
ncbi:DJ-1 family glyoxalase III [Clostridium felsineum]|uniref:Protein/nucleic acid deglycase 3 n=1 Tax=Clostridium felsineum TaxID=36839 RepID=A0A1S8LFX8_9CLOT|nr:DJ-1 family glyoxalase III [Clostridium felsineum]URZ06874.1 Protein/nucleic acid deglycase 3 [Clostridium felsineum]URZ11906.1 Protein/nucleic acid deglycase 3 [Clostridium felsineum]